MHCRGERDSGVPLAPLHSQLGPEEEEQQQERPRGRRLDRRGQSLCCSFLCDLSCLYPPARPWLPDQPAPNIGQEAMAKRLLLRGRASSARPGYAGC